MGSSAWGNVFATGPTRNVYAVTLLSDLRNITPPTGAATISVDGGIALADGGGGIFTWNATDVRADNGSTIIIPNAIIAPAPGRWNSEEALLFLGPGTVGAPSLTFGADLTSGLYSPGVGQIGVSIGGVQKSLWNAAGLKVAGVLGVGVVATSLGATFNPGNVLGITGAGTTNVTIVAQDATSNPALDVRNSSTGTSIFTVAGNGIVTVPGSVVTPLVGTTSAAIFQMRANAFIWNIDNAAGALYPNQDLVQDFGGTGSRIARVFTPIIDSGTTGSLSLKTNNGTTGLQVVNRTSADSPVLITPGQVGVVNVGLGIAGVVPLQITTNASPIYFGTDAVIPTLAQFVILHTASANRSITVTGAVSPNNPVLGATGGGVAIVGTTTNDNAATGQYGEYVESVIAAGAAVALATGVPSNVTSITLGAGDWDVTGTMAFLFGATTSYTNLIGALSTLTGALDAFVGGSFDYETPATVPTAGNDQFWTLPTRRISAAASITIFFVAQATFTVSTLKAYGRIRARRVR